MRLFVITLHLACLSTVVGQALPSLFGTSYQAESGVRLRIAPGQVVYLQMTGIGVLAGSEETGFSGDRVLRSQTDQLPLELGEISVYIGRPTGTSPSALQAIPLVAIEQLNQCEGSVSRPGCLVTVVTAIVPQDLEIDDTPIGPPVGPPPAKLRVRYKGTDGPEYRLIVTRSNVHFVRNCDRIGQRREVSCVPIVTDSAGSQVRTEPGPPQISRVEAIPGQTIVVYAYGLGSTSPQVPKGSKTPLGLFPVSATPTLVARWIDEAGSVKRGTVIEPAFVGLTPGQHGLYQMNIPIPEPPPGTPRCFSSVGYNLEIELLDAGTSLYRSADELRICVQVPR